MFGVERNWRKGMKEKKCIRGIMTLKTAQTDKKVRGNGFGLIHIIIGFLCTAKELVISQ